MNFEELLMLFFLLSTGVFISYCVEAEGGCEESHHGCTSQLAILAMAPFSDSERNASWPAGPGLIPAARLAVDHINNRTDVLENFTLVLLEGHSACEHVQQARVNLTAQVLHHNLSEKVVGIVGPGCSESAISVGDLVVRQKLNLIQVSIGTTPDINSTLENSFRSIGSSLLYVDALLEMASQYKWNRVGVLFDSGRPFHIKTYNAFRDAFQKRFVGGQLYSYPLIDNSKFAEFLEEILENYFRVVFVFARGNYASNVLCLTYKKYNMSFTNRLQYLFAERTREEFLAENASICTPDEMAIALNGVILMNNVPHRKDTESNNTVAGISFREFNKTYYESYLMTDAPNIYAMVSRHFSGFYDAVWTLALALNHSTEYVDLSQYKFGNPTGGMVTDKMREIILNNEFQFQGMSGLIAFDSERRDVPTIGVELLQCTQEDNSSNCETGSFANDTLDFTRLVEIDDEFKVEIHIVVPQELGITVILLAGIIAVLLFALQVVFCKYSTIKEIKAMSPKLNAFIFSGCYLLTLILIVTTFQEAFPHLLQHPVVFGVTCSVDYWCMAVSFSLIFGTISSKTWRIYRIFDHFRQGRVKYVSDKILTSFITSLVAIDIVLLTSWSLIDPWRLSREPVERDDISVFNRHVCKCDNYAFWISTLFAYKGLLVVLALALSVLVKRVKKKAFKMTKQIIALIYSLLFILFIGLSIYGFLFYSVPIVSYLGFCVMLISCVGVISFSVFLSNVWPVIANTGEQPTSALSRADVSTTSICSTSSKKIVHRSSSYYRDSTRSRKKVLM